MIPGVTEPAPMTSPSTAEAPPSVRPGRERSPWLFGIGGLTPATLAAWILWFAMVGTAWWATKVTGTPVVVCLFRNATGQPCPTCGGTRAGAMLLQGRIVDAFQLNPVVSAWLLVMPLFLIWRLVRREPLPPRVRKTLWNSMLISLGLGWAYMLWRGA